MQKLFFYKFHYAPSFTTLPERKFQDAINIRESSATPSNSRGARPVTETTREG
jgi:hypothetical protein